MPFNEALNNWPEVGISGPAKKGLANFTELIRQLSNRVSDGPAEILQLALERSGYIEELRDERSIEAKGATRESRRTHRFSRGLRNLRRIPRTSLTCLTHRRT
ncbi:MAG: hypothetical protein Ct9H300mP26_1510 [Acidimicrobiales bacterium]|nr:MAG: hypothetical protein Ct9H300mP26_1510 [Acidimicrobiales bacterium]